jgi:hypothetical protein
VAASSLCRMTVSSVRDTVGRNLSSDSMIADHQYLADG